MYSSIKASLWFVLQAYDFVWITNNNFYFREYNFAEEKGEVDKLSKTDDAGTQDESQPASNFSWKWTLAGLVS
jgi:hypothetical protein